MLRQIFFSKELDRNPHHPFEIHITPFELNLILISFLFVVERYFGRLQTSVALQRATIKSPETPRCLSALNYRVSFTAMEAVDS
jgi:hypothetical protein